jgi:SIT4-associating protein SAP185/190
VISTTEDESTGDPARINVGLGAFSTPFSFNRDVSSSPPTFHHSGFARSNSYSSNSSEEDGDESIEAVRRKVRLPLEIDDEEPDEIGDMAGPGAGLASAYSDDEDEALVGESLGYSSFFGAAGYAGAHGSGIIGGDDLLLEPDGRTDSSDGEEDDGLVEILVPSRRPT